MQRTQFLSYRPASADDVLDILRDWYRHSLEFDPEAEPGIALDFDATIDDWRRACDLLGHRKLGRALNQYFEIGVSDDEWRRVLHPPRARTLRGVCDTIARHARLPTVRRFRIFGGRCLSAGAFLTIRSLLAKAGVPVQGVRPTTRLDAIARDHFSDIIDVIGKIAPGVLPTPKLEKAYPRLSATLEMVLVVTFLLALLAGIVEKVFGRFEGLFAYLAYGTVFAFVCAYIGFIIIERIPYKSVVFGDLRTFRDLAEMVMQGGRSDR
jgi:hypothetical protein